MTPEKFGRYEVQAEIGDGAMGRVYRGFDPLARRTVAVKTIKSELLSKQSSEEYVRRFQREAQAAGRLSHPHIVTIFDVGENYFVMEFLEGETLQTLLKKKGHLGLHETLAIVDPVADAIDYAHRNGIIHRDIKPANIMVLADGRPKLMDFGVVHVDSTAMTAAGQFLGSPLYMAPEQIASGEVTGKTDVFALAAVTYEMLTGRRAFEGASITSIIYRVMNETPTAPRKWNIELPPHYDDVFAKALTKDPTARYPTATDFAGALDLKDFDESLHKAFSTLPEPAPPSSFDGGETHALADLVDTPIPTSPPSASDTQPWVRRARLHPTLIAAAVLVLGSTIWFAARHGRSGAATPAPAKPVPPLAVESEPAGAAVSIDDHEIGVTPLSVPNLSLGEHVVRVTRIGFGSGQLSISVTPDGIPPLHFVLEPLTASLHVVSDPVGSSVSLDGRALGAAPIEQASVAPGKHEITIERPGFRTYRTSVDAIAGKPVEVSAVLDKRVEKKAVAAPPLPTPMPETHEGDLVDLDIDVVPPRKISGNRPVYSREALGKHLTGKVTVDLLVTERGEATDLHVVESAGDILDKAVVEAIRTWRYEPATKNGVKVKVRIREWQAFSLRSS